MVTQPLAAYPVIAGWRLLDELDKMGADVTVAYWHFPEQEGQWLLVLTGPSVAKDGSRHLIEQLHEALSKISEDERQGLETSDIRTPYPYWREVEEMRRQYGRRNGDRSGDFPRPGFGSHDPYIYRMG